MTTSNANPPDDSTSTESGRNRRHDADVQRVDALFEVLSDARRRRVLRALRAADDDTVTVHTLAEALAPREPTDPAPDRLTVSLRHVHLPKLAAADVIEYDPGRSEIRYDSVPLVECLLDQL